MVEVKPGMTVWSDVLGANVEVLRVYKSTATVRVWGRGLAEGKLMTFRGQRLDSLRPKRSTCDEQEIKTEKFLSQG